MSPLSAIGAVERVDQGLAELAALTDPLLAVMPVNSVDARRRFLADGASVEPHLEYRPLTIDPDHIRRELNALPIDQIEDPTIGAVFREKRRELDAELDVLVRRGSADCLAASTVLYGAPGAGLVDRARHLLAVAQEATTTESVGAVVDAQTFALSARAEVDRYREQQPGIEIDIEIRDDIVGLVVERGRLLVGATLAVDEGRVDALIQHEVGTHALTWVNGSHQALHLFRMGLPHYDETQEALAVLAEFAVGGFTAGRMATIAARVIAVHCVVEGADFVETYRTLLAETGFTDASTFDVVLRVHRGGGFTRDVIYLRGLERLLAHLRAGGAVDDLLLGKYALDHLPVIDALRADGLLLPPVLLPAWLTRFEPDSMETQDLIAGARP